MAREDPVLLKPSLYALAGGLALSLICLIPIALSLVYLGSSPLGPLLAGFFGAVLVFAQLLSGCLFSAMTISLLSGGAEAGGERLDRAWAIVRRDWLDILSLAVAAALVGLIRPVLRGRGNQPERKLAGAGLSALWTEATYLVLPALALENLSLKEALARTAKIVEDNLVMMGVDQVGVRPVNALAGLVLGGTGLVLGWTAGAGLAGRAQGSPDGLLAAVAAGVLLASLFLVAAVVLTSYTSSVYHACLFLWARDVERARAVDPTASAAPPAPLAAALADITSLSTSIYS